MEFNLKSLPAIAIALLIFSVVLGIGATVLQNIADTNEPSGFNQSNPGTWSVTYNVTHGGQMGLDVLTGYQTTIAIIAIAAVIIGIILLFFGRGMR